MAENELPPNGPYASYGLYWRPKDEVAVTLRADPDDKRYYINKGFVFLAYVEDPGVVAPIVGPPVANRRSLADAMGAAEDQALKVLRENKVSSEKQDEVMAMLAGKMLAPREPVTNLDPRTTTIPGELVARGVTRGVPGLDVTMPSVVPGISHSNPTHQRDAELRGEIDREERKVTDAEGNEYTIMVPRAVAPEDREKVRGRAVSERRRSMGQHGQPSRLNEDRPAAFAPVDPESPPYEGHSVDVTTAEQSRQQAVREDTMRAEGEAKGDSSGGKPTPGASRPSSSSRSSSARRR